MATKTKRGRGPAADAPEDAAGLIAAGVRRLEWLAPKELAANPANFREHSAAQMATLRESIAGAGWAKPLILNETTGNLIDGHARLRKAVEDGDAAVPVNVGSWTEEQESLLLASLDAIAAQATIDPARFDALNARLRSMSPGLGPAMGGLLESLRADPFFARGLGGAGPVASAPIGATAGAEEPEPPAEFPAYGEDIATDFRCPKCAYEWSGKPR